MEKSEVYSFEIRKKEKSVQYYQLPKWSWPMLLGKKKKSVIREKIEDSSVAQYYKGSKV